MIFVVVVVAVRLFEGTPGGGDETSVLILLCLQ